MYPPSPSPGSKQWCKFVLFFAIRARCTHYRTVKTCQGQIMMFEELRCQVRGYSLPSALIALDNWWVDCLRSLAARTATTANGHILSYESKGQRLRAEWSCEFGCWVSLESLLHNPFSQSWSGCHGVDIVFYLLILRILLSSPCSPKDLSSFCFLHSLILWIIPP